MPSVRLTPEARRDLADIFRYTAQHWSIEQATRYTSELDSIFIKIAQRPKAGRPRDGFEPGLRSRTVRRHTIYYRELKDGIWVIRILHAAQDPDASFPPPGVP